MKNKQTWKEAWETAKKIILPSKVEIIIIACVVLITSMICTAYLLILDKVPQ